MPDKTPSMVLKLHKQIKIRNFGLETKYNIY